MRFDDEAMTLKSIVNDKSNASWYIEFTKKQFNNLKDDYHVEAFNEDGVLVKKFIKKFLIHKSELTLKNFISKSTAKIKLKKEKVKKVEVEDELIEKDEHDLFDVVKAFEDTLETSDE